jgi:hypothetical protein
VAAYDLCTIQDVRARLQKPTADVNQDEIIQNLISQASKAIMKYTGREFAPAGVAGVMRTFETEIGPDTFLSLAPWDLQTSTLVRIDTDVTGTTLSSDEYRFFPVGKPDGVYTSVRLQPLSMPQINRVGWRNRQVQITGTWGFPEIPADVNGAAAETVALWLRRDVSAFTSTYNLDESRVERPEALPSAVRAQLGDYMRMAYV